MSYKRDVFENRPFLSVFSAKTEWLGTNIGTNIRAENSHFISSCKERLHELKGDRVQIQFRARMYIVSCSGLF